MPRYIVEIKLVANKHEDGSTLRGGPPLGNITDHIERSFAGNGTSFATVMSDLQERVSAYTVAEEKLLNPEVKE